MLKDLLEHHPEVPVLHLTRHPYAWLFFMSVGACECACWVERISLLIMNGKEVIMIFPEDLKLKPYTKDDVEIWTTYQGMWKMNDVAADIKVPIRQVTIEDVISNRLLFAELIEFLTDGQVTYSEELLNLIYSWIWTPFDGEEKLRIVPSEDRATWPDWKLLRSWLAQKRKTALNRWDICFDVPILMKKVFISL